MNPWIMYVSGVAIGFALGFAAMLVMGCKWF